MTPAETANVLRILVAAYRRDVTDDQAELWANVFSSDDTDDVMAAVEEWVATQTRFPTPAGIRELVRNAKRRREMLTPELVGGGERIVPFPEGIQIAYRAYCAEVTSQGREPRSFEEFSGQLAGMNRQQRRKVMRR